MRPVTLTVLCEGLTEQRFIAQVVRPHLLPFGVFAKGQLLKPGGGIVTFSKLREQASRALGKRDHLRVTTLVDLYGLPEDYPQWKRRGNDSAGARATHIAAGMHAEMPDPRFLPFVQVHEFEALVLSDLDALGARFPDDDGPAAAAGLLEQIKNVDPEDVNDGKHTAPSKRILEVLPGYNKAVDGPIITASIGMPHLRKRCPHFDGWVARLEALGQAVKTTSS